MSSAAKGTKKAQQKLQQRKVKSAKRFKLAKNVETVFNILDRNGDGKVSSSELERGSRLLGYNPTREEAVQMITECSPAEPGFLTRREFTKFFEIHKTDLETQMDEFRKAFQQIDKKNTGYISTRKLRLIMEQCCSDMGESEIDELIAIVDKDNNGKIDLEEFAFTLCELDAFDDEEEEEEDEEEEDREKEFEDSY